MEGMVPRDIALMTQASEVRVSPDGARLVFAVVGVDLDANDYRIRIWVGPADGSSPPFPFTSGEGKDVLPRWSPDGTRLAFVSERSQPRQEERCSEVIILPVAVGGQPIKAAVVAEEVSELEWSPDGSRLALVARDPDMSRYGSPGSPTPEANMPPRRVDHLFFRLDSVGWTFDRPNRVFVVPTDGSCPPAAITAGPFEASHLTWSPDGTRLAYVSARHDTWDLDVANDVWWVAADGSGEPERLTDTAAQFSHPAWSPDGNRLACLRTRSVLDEPRHAQVVAIDISSRQVVELSTSLDRTCAPFVGTRSPVWEGDDVVFAVEDGGNVHLYRAPSSGDAKPELVVGGDQTISSWDWAGGTLSFVASSPTNLADVFVGTTGRRLTSFDATFAAAVELSAPQRFVAASADATEVECWAMPPVGARPGDRYPTLLNIHGGPYTQYGNKFFDEFQLQAGAGFAVLYCNPRGSSGYSEAWARAIRWPEADPDPGSGWGGVDYDDVMACVAEAERRFPWIDPDRVGVLGGSYGGYMTSWIIGHTDKFRAACSERACNNLLTLEQSSDIASSLRCYIGKSHVEDPMPYQRHSPITFLHDMSTPVLILHSEQDLRCPINQAEELFVGLRLLGRRPVMVRFPAESHELSRSGSPRHRVMRAELILDWFSEQLAEDREGRGDDS